MELRKVNLVDAYAEWEYTSNLPEDEIYLRLLKTNIASLRVMEKNGARCVGEDADHFFMRIAK